MLSNFLRVTQQIRVWEESRTSLKWGPGDSFPRGNMSQRRKQGESAAEQPVSHKPLGQSETV